MNTNYNVGDTVYLEVKIEEININCNDGTMYRISCKDCIWRPNSLWVKEDQLNVET